MDGATYVTADFLRQDVDFRVDLSNSSQVRETLGEAPFSLVICSHVLEHISDDVSAMRSLRLLVSGNGIVLISVPLDSAREQTFEDGTITSFEGRALAFGQGDHLRIYGQDIAQRLGSAGFAVSSVEPQDLLSEAERLRHAIWDTETLFVCRPANSI